MRRGIRYLASLGIAMAVLAGIVIFSPGGGATPVKAFNPTALQQRLFSGVLAETFGNHSLAAAQARSSGVTYFPTGPANECPANLGSNVKVNQNCLNISSPNLQGRGQAHNETAIAVNPGNPNQVIAASNDYRLGDGLAGGIAYSSDGGKHWQDGSLPVEFTQGSDFAGNPNARMYWQGGGDPSLAWDTRGNAYFAGLRFNRGLGTSDNPDFSSAVYVHRSVGNGGASWDFPGTAATTSLSQFQPTTPAAGVPLDDKPYMTIDDSTSSPFRDRIYVTWTLFAADGTSYIYEAWSQDYGRTFSSPVLVSNNSDALCPQNYTNQGIGVTTENGNNCDVNQFSQPFTGSDGNLYVVFANYNTATVTNTAPGSDNRVQVLLEKSTDGGGSFGAPVQVGYFYDLPDCATYQGGQDAFRQCVPEQGSQMNSVFRATNYPSGAVDPTNSSHILVSYGSYVNVDSQGTTAGNGSTGCAPNGTTGAGGAFTDLYSGVKTAACANKILISESTNAGTTFSGTGADPRTVAIIPQQAGQAHADQWWQWAAFDSRGQFVASYYDRQYGNDITTAANDVTLSIQPQGGRGLTFNSQRVTTSSMPNPTQFGDAQGNGTFFGDYAGLAVGDTAHPLWMDTRNRDLFDCPGSNPPALCTLAEANGQIANNQDLFTASIGL